MKYLGLVIIVSALAVPVGAQWVHYPTPGTPRAADGKLILILDEGLVYRQVFIDGRPLETDPNPSWMGYSVGHWDGDTLVIDSAGFNDETWLDSAGHPHTEALRMTERYHRRDFGHMDIE